MTIDAVRFSVDFTRNELDAEAICSSTIRLLVLVEREHIWLVIFGHDNEQWETFKKASAYYD